MSKFPFDEEKLEKMQAEESDEKQKEELKIQAREIIDNEMDKLAASYDHNFKMITIGQAFSGKTSFLKRYFKNIFDNWVPTITVDFFTKCFKIHGKSVLITAFDTAGSENYRSMTSKYVRDKHCLLFFFDLTNKASFEALDDWYAWSRDYRRDDAVLILIGNKKDGEREVETEEAMTWANTHNMGYFETSAKENLNVDDAFEFAVEKCFKRF